MRELFSFYFKREEVDVMFYYPQHFTEHSNKIRGLQPLIKACHHQGISYVLLEEPNNNCANIRNKNAVKVDFIFYLAVFLRKLSLTKNSAVKDNEIGMIVSKILFLKRKVKNIVTISQSFQSVLRGMHPNATLFDYQHGILSSIFDGYTQNQCVSEQILINHVKVLLHGDSYKQKLLKLKGGGYFEENSIVIGSPYGSYSHKEHSFDGNILVSLQLSTSHTKLQNQILHDGMLDLFSKIQGSYLNLNFFLRPHPRFNECIEVADLYAFDFVNPAPTALNDCFKECSLHLTEYSTMVFDSITNGIPSILSNFSNEFNVLDNEYSFPKSENDVFVMLQKVSDSKIYSELVSGQEKWAKSYCEPFDSSKFLSLLSS